MDCCPTFFYPCLYGNAAKSYTKTCEFYYKDGGPATATIAANTIFTDCLSKSNEIALELATYETQSQAHCMACCSRSICVFLDNPEDALNFDYFSIAQGVRVHTDTRICFQTVDDCSEPPGFGFFVRIQGATAVANGGCIELLAGIVGSFKLGTAGPDNFLAPENFAIGWDCNIDCPVNNSVSNVVTFPMGIAQCDEGFPE